jgi:hypothetical protein
MVMRNETLPDAADEPADAGGPVARQRSARTDPGMRDGDSGRGNPYESIGDDPTGDNDVGDTHPTAAAPDVEDLPVTAGAGEPEEMEDAGTLAEHPRVATAPAAPPADVSDLDGEEMGEVTAAPAVATAAAAPPARPLEGDPPIPGYVRLSVAEVVARAATLSVADLRAVLAYEQSHCGRKTLLAQLDRRLRAAKRAG